MKPIIFIAVMLCQTLCFAQEGTVWAKGHNNERGFFQYDSYTAGLETLDYVRKIGINGNTYFYFQMLNKTTGRSYTVLLMTEHPYTMDSIASFSDLVNGITVASAVPELENYIVDDSIYTKVAALSEDRFFKKYITKLGILKAIGDFELEKAVIYRLLKANYSVSQDDVSGGWGLGRL